MLLLLGYLLEYTMKTWKVIHPQSVKNEKLDSKIVLSILLENRKIESSDVPIFLKPQLKDITLKSSDISAKEYEIFKKRIDKAIAKSETIVIYGDYDVDGICAAAILWETIYSKTKKVIPYIPDRADEGYGLSIKGIDNILAKNPETKLIITVDNGIVAYSAVDYANTKGIDVVVTDHHVAEKKKPASVATIHTTSLCGAGIAWVLSKELAFETKEVIHEKLSLACLATVADLVPLAGNNRAIVSHGLKLLQSTKRVGIKALLREASIEENTVSTYTIGHVIAPRLNATGRIQSAMNALRLLCTKDKEKAHTLSQMLAGVNKDRQDMTEESVSHAKLLAVQNLYSERIIIVQSNNYNAGVVGLIASRLVESSYKPAFAISVGEEISKGSARSVAGVNIIELLRSIGHTLVEAGGHPMAAGFSVETSRLEEFSKALAKASEDVVTDDLLNRILKIDMVIPLSLITVKFIDEIGVLEPYGMGNPQPTFASYNVEIVEIRKIGKAQNHLKMKIREDQKIIDAVAFNFADKSDVVIGDKIDIAYTVDVNEWNGKITPQLKIKDMVIH